MHVILRWNLPIGLLYLLDLLLDMLHLHWLVLRSWLHVLTWDPELHHIWLLISHVHTALEGRCALWLWRLLLHPRLQFLLIHLVSLRELLLVAQDTLV